MFDRRGLITNKIVVGAAVASTIEMIGAEVFMFGHTLVASVAIVLTTGFAIAANLTEELRIPEGAQAKQVPFPVEGMEKGIRIDDPELKWAPCGGDAYTKGGTFLAGCEAAVLRTDPKTGGLEMFVRTPASFVWPTHWHSNSEHLIGIQGTTPIHFEDGSIHNIQPGEFIYIPNGLIHSAYCTDAAPCMFFLRTDKASDFNIVKK